MKYVRDTSILLQLYASNTIGENKKVEDKQRYLTTVLKR